ncbi:MAG: hypothetical protein PHY48_02410 [Candidatus Cloacimonetes bacterium]|nr:hypothetical protein [Candidatus Cloacimonadota bacterium]
MTIEMWKSKTSISPLGRHNNYTANRLINKELKSKEVHNFGNGTQAFFTTENTEGTEREYLQRAALFSSIPMLLNIAG